jgi:hypothetical protein
MIREGQRLPPPLVVSWVQAGQLPAIALRLISDHGSSKATPKQAFDWRRRNEFRLTTRRTPIPNPDS